MIVRANYIAQFNNLVIRLDDFKFDRVEKFCDNLYVYYQGKKICGYSFLNINKEDFKVINNGRIKVNSEFIDVLNQVLLNHKLPKIEADLNNYIKACKIVEVSDHPHSNKLKVCKVDVGEKIIQVVTNLTEIQKDIICVVALEGAVIQDNLIVPSLVNKVESQGMFVSEKSLEINEHKPGLIILDSNYQIGGDYFG